MASPTRVRTLGVTAAVSLLVHGAALAWVISRPKPEQKPAVTAPRVELEEPLTIVELVSDPPAPAPVAAPQRGDSTTGVRPGTVKNRRIAAADSRPATGAETAPVVVKPVEPPATTTPGKPPVRRLAMRSGPQIPTTADQIAALALARPDTRPLPDYPGVRNQAALDVAKAQHDLQGIVAAREAIAAEELKAQKDGTWKTDKTTFVAKVDRDGRVSFDDKRNLQVKGFHGTFDATDWAMRSQGMDPYAAEKLAYLDRTRDQRVEIAKAYRKEQLGHSAQLMQAHLDRLWRSTTDVAARKQGLFELWDECAETGEPEVVDGGQAARALLLRWVHVKLTGATAFTAAELSRLNAKRRSKAVFDP